MNGATVKEFMKRFELPSGGGDANDAIEKLRARGVTLLGIASVLTTLALIIASLWLRPSTTPMLVVIGVLTNIAPTWVVLKHRHDAQARVIVGTTAVTNPAIFVYLLQGSPWQMDSHLFFLASLASLMMLCDWVPIMVAAGLIAGHHLLFELVAPNWVFNTQGNIARVLFHALAIAMESSVLAQVTLLLNRLLAGQADALAAQRKLVDMAEVERTRASVALERAQAANDAATSERTQRKALEDRTATERQAELMILAAEFERTVAEVVKTIHTSSQGLENLAIQLDDVASDADREASAAAHGAANTTSDIRQVAAAIGDLSESIRTIAVAAGHQNDLTDTAAGEGARSVETIALLDSQVIEIDAFIEDIRGIAAKTNLLALNATIEAARAGDAGRGFAVVAGEVKSLAADAARASERIRDLLTDIRAGVSATAQKINGATDAVRDVAVAASQIANAVTEQNGYAGEIDRSAARAASGADMIERQMEGVALAISSAVALSAQVRGDAATLATGARDLRSSTQRFVAFLRDAELAAAE